MSIAQVLPATFKAAVAPGGDVFSEDWASGTINGSIWERLNNDTHFTYSAATNALVASADGLATATDALRTINTFDVRDRHIQVEAVSLPSGSDISYFITVDSGGRYIGFKKTSSTLSAVYSSGVEIVVGSATYNSTAHRFFRFRVSAADLAYYWETSPDGTTWTMLTHLTGRSMGDMTFTAMKIRLQLNSVSGSASSQTWDNIRVYDFDATGWTVADLAIAQFKASAVTGLSDGDPVGSIPDSVGAFTATASGSDRPLWRSGSGTPYLEFNNNNIATSITNTFDDFMFIAIVDVDSTNPSAGRIADKNYINGAWIGTQPGVATAIGGGIREASPPYGNFIGFSYATKYAVTRARQGTVGHTWLGTNHISNSVSSTALDSTALHIGSAYGGGDRAVIKLYELIIVDKMMNAFELTALNAYLRATYGISF